MISPYNETFLSSTSNRLSAILPAILRVVTVVLNARISANDTLHVLARSSSEVTSLSRQAAALYYPRLHTPPSTKAFAEKTYQAALSSSPTSYDAPAWAAMTDVTMFLTRLAEFANVSSTVFLMMMVYIDRLSAHNPSLLLSSRNAHRLLSSAFLVAAKYLEDVSPPTPSLAAVCGLSTAELLSHERQFLTEMKYALGASAEQVAEAELVFMAEALDTPGGIDVFSDITALQVSDIDLAFSHTESWTHVPPRRPACAKGTYAPCAASLFGATVWADRAERVGWDGGWDRAAVSDWASPTCMASVSDWAASGCIAGASAWAAPARIAGVSDWAASARIAGVAAAQLRHDFARVAVPSWRAGIAHACAEEYAVRDAFGDSGVARLRKLRGLASGGGLEDCVVPALVGAIERLGWGVLARTGGDSFFTDGGLGMLAEAGEREDQVMEMLGCAATRAAELVMDGEDDGWRGGRWHGMGVMDVARWSRGRIVGGVVKRRLRGKVSGRFFRRAPRTLVSQRG